VIKLLVELINASLCKRPLSVKVFEGATETVWQQCFDHALQQNVLAMTFSVMSSLPKELCPSFTLWAKWMAYEQEITNQSEYKRDVVKKIGSWLDEDGLSTTILKGFALSALYPNPNLREFSDIDIFSGENYDAVNTCFAKHGVPVRSVDGHHAYFKVDGISVEHHFAFTNTKVKHGLHRPETELQQLVLNSLRQTSVPGILFPCNEFMTVHVGNHAYGHFLQEKILLRHVIDWALALRQLSEQDAEKVGIIKGDTLWGKFTNTLTAIAIHQLYLPQSWFPKKELELAMSISTKQELRVWNDIINTGHTPKNSNSNLRRLNIAKRILKNAWKYKDYANISAKEMLLKNVAGHLKSKMRQLQS